MSNVEEMLRCLQSILNKVTLADSTALMDQLEEISLDSNKKRKAAIKLIFKNVKSERSPYSMIYARICSRLMMVSYINTIFIIWSNHGITSSSVVQSVWGLEQMFMCPWTLSVTFVSWSRSACSFFDGIFNICLVFSSSSDI